MIAKVVRGWKPAGLIRYLFGPGKYEEHENPRVVAAWDGAPWLHHPDKPAPIVMDGRLVEPGEFDFDLGPLTGTMQDLAELAGLPLNTPPSISPEWARRVRDGDVPPDAPTWLSAYRYDVGKNAVVLRPGYVWHTPVRLHPDDPTLTDEQWEHIAERLMKSTGIHQAGCRWIAVRHADDHIHLMATLVSETTGKLVSPHNDFYKLREECRRLEEEFGLVRTAGVDRTAVPTPSRAEKAKAERLGRPVTAREELHRLVAQAAAGATDGEGFLAALKAQGLDPRTVHYADGRVRGYTVALPGDLTADGERVRYSGSKLAADLTWPRLEQRWASVPPLEAPERSVDLRVTPAERREALESAADVVRRAEAVVRAARTTVSADDGGTETGGTRNADGVEGIAHAAGEVLAALARGQEGRDAGPLSDAAAIYDRAARTPVRVLPDRLGPVARELRMASRRLVFAGTLAGRGKEKFAAAALLLALAGLIAEIAAWQQRRGRVHQAAAARAAVEVLPAPARPTSAPRPIIGRVAPGDSVVQDRPATPRPATTGQPRPRGRTMG
ncbi:relaxase/mobilization nuclease domain-containing protein [Saccharothrix sp.]|uniref:relaxase/mobilization nuclease domain-containing protein n=1 Tax=Saccharothrix sp. TaxID=1873460 RepID=UPI002810B6F8|nr:relaxase/mobilization nuclease domain-containing protein [Saccharothrix sp.]